MKRRYFPLILGLLLLAVFLTMILFPGLFTDCSPKDMFPKWLPADGEHPLGTNAMGYDIFTELVYGAGRTLLVGLLSGVLSLALGTLIGVLAAGKGVVAALCSGLINIFVLLPRLITLIVLSAFLGSSQLDLIVLISLFSWVGTARNVRSKVQHLRTLPYMEGLVVRGFSRPHILLHHVIPALADVLLTRFLLGVNSCIMMESTLSFLGFGDLYHPTWGTMVNFAWKRGAFMRGAYAYVLTPGLCVVLLSLSFYFISLYFERRKDFAEYAS